MHQNCAHEHVNILIYKTLFIWAAHSHLWACQWINVSARESATRIQTCNSHLNSLTGMGYFWLPRCGSWSSRLKRQCYIYTIFVNCHQPTTPRTHNCTKYMTVKDNVKCQKYFRDRVLNLRPPSVRASFILLLWNSVTVLIFLNSTGKSRKVMSKSCADDELNL